MGKECKGKCPKCGSENIEYWNSELLDDSIGYNLECMDCGCHAIEWYKLTYDETVIKE